MPSKPYPSDVNSVTLVKLGFLVVLLGAVAAGATATSGWLVGEPTESSSSEPTATTASGADGTATPPENDSIAAETPTTGADAPLVTAALVVSGS